MSDEYATQPAALGAIQAGAQTRASAGARMDTEGAVPTDYTGRVPATRGLQDDATAYLADLVSRRPWQTVVASAILGCIIGNRTNPKVHTLRVDYVSPAISRTRGAMMMLAAGLIGAFRARLQMARMKAHDARLLARCYSRPMRKAVRKAAHRAQKKMHAGKSYSFFQR